MRYGLDYSIRGELTDIILVSTDVSHGDWRGKAHHVGDSGFGTFFLRNLRKNTAALPHASGG